jgi:hypothetical protein
MPGWSSPHQSGQGASDDSLDVEADEAGDAVPPVAPCRVRGDGVVAAPALAPTVVIDRGGGANPEHAYGPRRPEWA